MIDNKTKNQVIIILMLNLKEKIAKKAEQSLNKKLFLSPVKNEAINVTIKYIPPNIDFLESFITAMETNTQCAGRQNLAK